MTNQTHVRILLCSLMVLVFLAGGIAQSKAIDKASGRSAVENRSDDSAVGRVNPFARLIEQKKPAAAPVASTPSAPVKVVKPKPALSVATVVLKFLDADKLKPAIEMMRSEYGSIASNPENNSLIVCDTEKNIEKILAEIRKADKAPQQIMVEVVIADVQLKDDTEIGINWDILSDKNYDFAYRQNFTSRLGSTIASAANVGNATAFNTTGTGGNFSIISGTIRNVLTLLQQKKKIKILASPRVMVVSGKTASIKAVEEIPYNEIVDTSFGGTMSSTRFKEVGVTLDVGATITDDDHIHVTIDATQNVATGESATEVPIIDTRNAKTELLLKDGQIVVMGGLRRKEIHKQVKQIPILGDIPLIGLLFRSTNTIVTNSELIIFLSPHVYKGEPIPKETMAKFKEITEGPILSLPLDKDKPAEKPIDEHLPSK